MNDLHDTDRHEYIHAFNSERTEREEHRCVFTSSGRCSCGRHRNPALATGIAATGSAAERLKVCL